MTCSHQSAYTRLATYGTLAPGQINNNQLSGLKGHWLEGTVKGTLVEAGWGKEHGCPGLVLDPLGHLIDVSVFVSPELNDHWPRLDAFEGVEYRRVITKVHTQNSVLDASIYVIDI